MNNEIKGMNPVLEDALRKYLETGEASALVTRDEKLMGIINSFGPDVKPSVEDIKQKYVNAINNIQETPVVEPVVAQEESVEIKPDTIVPAEPQVAAPTPKEKKLLNSMGYANIVLMSIIVMIIVAIVCVFIFL